MVSKLGVRARVGPKQKEYLKTQARLHLLSKHFGDAAIEICEDFHGKLGRDALLADEVVKSIGQCHPNASVR